MNVAGGQAKVAVPPKIDHVKALSQAGRGIQDLAPEVEPPGAGVFRARIKTLDSALRLGKIELLLKTF